MGPGPSGSPDYSFWLNGTSRMYLLDGLKPALQALGCAAGDLITFSYLRTPHAERNDLDCPNDLLLVGFQLISKTHDVSCNVALGRPIVPTCRSFDVGCIFVEAGHISMSALK